MRNFINLLFTKYYKVVKSRKMSWVEYVAHVNYTGKHEGKIPLGRPRRKWVYNIKIDLREI
jgi:hypothetical protein